MSQLDYPWLIQEALRGVARQALAQIADEGLEPPHHFYLSFLTGAPGVVMPQVLRDTYPEEMTIILEHQFWDLEVDDTAFSVTLAFSGVQHRLTVPFTALTVFADPGADMGLRFQPRESFDAAREPADRKPDESRASSRRTAKPTREQGGAEIVSLESFRSPRQGGHN